MMNCVGNGLNGLCGGRFCSGFQLRRGLTDGHRQFVPVECPRFGGVGEMDIQNYAVSAGVSILADLPHQVAAGPDLGNQAVGLGNRNQDHIQ